MGLTVKSKRLSVNNLGSQMTGEIKYELSKQDLLNIPTDMYTDYTPFRDDEDLLTIMDKEMRDHNAKHEKKLGLTDGLLNALKKEDPTTPTPTNRNESLMMGQCTVVNPQWQFNELDDVRSNRSHPQIGRVYSTYIYSNQPVIVFQPGREKYNVNFFSFFTKNLGGDHNQLNKYIREGGDPSLFTKIRLAFVSVKNTILAALDGALQLVGIDSARADKYILFKPAMRAYRNMMNGLLRDFAGNMGLLDLTSETSTIPDMVADFQSDNPAPADVTGYSSSNQTSLEGNPPNDRVTEHGTSEDKYEAYASTYRGSIKKLDIAEMLPGTELSTHPGLGKMIDVQNKNYIPFLCQNSISVSETFSNSSQSHPVVEHLNSLSQENKDSNSFGGAKHIIDAMSGGSNIFEMAKGAVDNLVNVAAKKIGGESINSTAEMGMVLNGSGKILIPEVWNSSNYSRSYSVDFKFFSPVGDVVSIFENTYIPFLYLLGLTAPIQTGKLMYMAPFMVKVFSKGLFSIDFGMIESLGITRGEDKNDRTRFGYPRTIKVSLSIKDLQPAMVLSMGGSAFWKYKKANSSLTEYISTLCCLDISDRHNIARTIDKFISTITSQFRETISLENIGYNFSHSFIPFKAAAWWTKGGITAGKNVTKNIFQ